LQIVKKHVGIQLPLLPTPGIVSLDLIGVTDTLLEMYDYAVKKLGLVPHSTDMSGDEPFP
jgi:hypothetical protein